MHICKFGQALVITINLVTPHALSYNKVYWWFCYLVLPIYNTSIYYIVLTTNKRVGGKRMIATPCARDPYGDFLCYKLVILITGILISR